MSGEEATLPQYSVPAPAVPQSKYSQLLAVIDELGKDLRPTYTGNKMSAERIKRSIIHARILLIDADRRVGEFCFLSLDLILQRTIPCSSGIFRFQSVIDSSNGEHWLFGALCNGRIAIVNGSEECTETRQFSDGMLLSIQKLGDRFLCGDTLGTVRVLDLQEECCSWQVWSSAWLDDNTVLSGGDDGLFKAWDIRSKPIAPIAVSKEHKAGVVSIHPDGDNLILTGSYDEQLRLWDARNLRHAMSSVMLDGGVWSIEKCPNGDSWMTACMYGGWNLVGGKDFQVLESSHPELGKNLLYGASTTIESGNLLVASCTFNDSMVRIDQLQCSNDLL